MRKWLERLWHRLCIWPFRSDTEMVDAFMWYLSEDDPKLRVLWERQQARKADGDAHQ